MHYSVPGTTVVPVSPGGCRSTTGGHAHSRAYTPASRKRDENVQQQQQQQYDSCCLRGDTRTAFYGISKLLPSLSPSSSPSPAPAPAPLSGVDMGVQHSRSHQVHRGARDALDPRDDLGPYGKFLGGAVVGQQNPDVDGPRQVPADEKEGVQGSRECGVRVPHVLQPEREVLGFWRRAGEVVYLGLGEHEGVPQAAGGLVFLAQFVGDVHRFGCWKAGCRCSLIKGGEGKGDDGSFVLLFSSCFLVDVPGVKLYDKSSVTRYLLFVSLSAIFGEERAWHTRLRYLLRCLL